MDISPINFETLLDPVSCKEAIVNAKDTFFKGICQFGGIDIQTKLKSELFSKCCEHHFSNTLQRRFPSHHVRKATADRDPDIQIGSVSVEVKVTSTHTAFTGGTLSNRSSLYILISHQDYSRFFVAALYLDKEHWKKAKNGTYYGTTLSMKNLASLPKQDLVGKCVWYETPIPHKRKTNEGYLNFIREEI